jgi:hypothetical protein
MITKLTIKGIVPGLNGKHGLIREHFRNAKKRKNLYTILCREQNPNKHPGKVIIHYIGYKSVLMDWDNFSASFKHIGDALVDLGVIVDDKPSIVTQFLPQQIKSKRVDQRVEVIIEDVE